jgi:hypothetical protein
MTQHIEAIIMEGVKEYAEEMDVRLGARNGRLTIDARNEGGHNGTDVDLVQLLLWVQKNLPELLQCPWVGLTEEEILDLFDRNNVYGSKWIEFARTVEAKLKEKNV